MSKFTLHSLKITVSASYSQVDYQTFLEKSVAQVRCPKCKSKYYLKNHDWYPRHLYISPDERLVIRMRRLKCSSCMITFIVLPPTVIPYKRYVMETIYSVLKQLTTHSIYWLEKTEDLTPSSYATGSTNTAHFTNHLLIFTTLWRVILPNFIKHTGRGIALCNLFQSNPLIFSKFKSFPDFPLMVFRLID